MGLVMATIVNASIAGDKGVPVLFNPSELTVTTNILYPEISVPGLQIPLLQFVRGESRRWKPSCSSTAPTRASR